MEIKYQFRTRHKIASQRNPCATHKTIKARLLVLFAELTVFTQYGIAELFTQPQPMAISRSGPTVPDLA